jgi:hypothetical protein
MKEYLELKHMHIYHHTKSWVYIIQKQ